MRVVIATNNQNKLREFSELAGEEPWLELQLAPDGFNPKETGTTFVENARIKAKAAALASGMTSVADDSGLIIEALNGRPGIKSARYIEGTDADRSNKILEELQGVPESKRQAAFMCAMVVCTPDGEVAYSSIRAWEGTIAMQARGENGFGYDPIFLPNNRQVTAAELSPDEKNKLSHRAQAWRQVVQYLKKNVEFSVKVET
jgi:XTP/dITP diphosphohydrolase